MYSDTALNCRTGMAHEVLTSFDWSQDRSTILTGASNAEVRIWDIEQARRIFLYPQIFAKFGPYFANFQNKYWSNGNKERKRERNKKGFVKKSLNKF